MYKKQDIQRHTGLSQKKLLKQQWDSINLESSMKYQLLKILLKSMLLKENQELFQLITLGKKLLE